MFSVNITLQLFYYHDLFFICYFSFNFIYCYILYKKISWFLCAHLQNQDIPEDIAFGSISGSHDTGPSVYQSIDKNC